MNALTLIIIVASIIILMVGVGIMSAMNRRGQSFQSLAAKPEIILRQQFATAAMQAIITNPNPDIRELLARTEPSLAAKKITALAYLYADWMIQRINEGKP